MDIDYIDQDGGQVVVFTARGRTSINLAGSETLEKIASGIRSAAERSEVRCAILQGCTPQAFIGGADLKELGQLTTATAESFIRGVHNVCSTIREFPVPVIARIQGYCLGAGLEIAAACDFRVADKSAVFGMPEVKIGVPSVVEAALLVQLIGWGRTRELVYRGHMLDAEEAERIGLIEQLVDNGDIDMRVAECVNDILEAAPNAIRIQKSLCREWEGNFPADAIAAGIDAFTKAYETDEPKRYVDEFFKKNAARKRDA